MHDIVFSFERTLKYFECVIVENQLENQFKDQLYEQKENLNDLNKILDKYRKNILIFNDCDSSGSGETLDKLMVIHKFITDLEWHISEISELKDEVIKAYSSRRG